MAKILETRLPLATDGEVSADTFNRLVRILEINLGAKDIDKTPVFNASEISALQFATGAIIFNSTVEVHQAFDGTDDWVRRRIRSRKRLHARPARTRTTKTNVR
jgi:hypothetical protein